MPDSSPLRGKRSKTDSHAIQGKPQNKQHLHDDETFHRASEEESDLVTQLQVQIRELKEELLANQAEIHSMKEKYNEQQSYIRKCEVIIRKYEPSFFDEPIKPLQPNQLPSGRLPENIRLPSILPSPKSTQSKQEQLQQLQQPLKQLQQYHTQQAHEKKVNSNNNNPKKKLKTSITSASNANQTEDKRFQVTEEMLDCELDDFASLSPWDSALVGDDTQAVQPVSSQASLASQHNLPNSQSGQQVQSKHKISASIGIDAINGTSFEPSIGIEKGFLSEQKRRIKPAAKSIDMVHSFIPKSFASAANSNSKSQQQSSQLQQQVTSQFLLHSVKSSKHPKLKLEILQPLVRSSLNNVDRFKEQNGSISKMMMLLPNNNSNKYAMHPESKNSLLNGSGDDGNIFGTAFHEGSKRSARKQNYGEYQLQQPLFMNQQIAAEIQRSETHRMNPHLSQSQPDLQYLRIDANRVNVIPSKETQRRSNKQSVHTQAY